MTIHVRAASTDDVEHIAAANQAMAMETEQRTLDERALHNGVARLLADDRKGRYWIAELEGRFAGQIMVTLEWSDWRDGYFWWIQSVYVAPNARRRGVFRALFDVVAGEARDANAAGIRLYVEKDNQAAYETYLAMGMHEPDYRMMEVDFKKGV